MLWPRLETSGLGDTGTPNFGLWPALSTSRISNRPQNWCTPEFSIWRTGIYSIVNNLGFHWIPLWVPKSDTHLGYAFQQSTALFSFFGNRGQRTYLASTSPRARAAPWCQKNISLFAGAMDSTEFNSQLSSKCNEGIWHLGHYMIDLDWVSISIFTYSHTLRALPNGVAFHFYVPLEAGAPLISCSSQVFHGERKEARTAAQHGRPECAAQSLHKPWKLA